MVKTNINNDKNDLRYLSQLLKNKKICSVPGFEQVPRCEITNINHTCTSQIKTE